MKVFVLVQVEEEIHETEGCECGCGEGWETNYETHCSVIKVSTNRKKLEDIIADAEKQNEETNIHNQKMLDDYQGLVQIEQERINVLYAEQYVKLKKLFENYKNTVNEGLNTVGKEKYNVEKKIDWFTGIYYNKQSKDIIYEFFQRYPELKLKKKDLEDLTECDLKEYQNFQKTQFEYPVIKPLIVPYQIIEKELED